MFDKPAGLPNNPTVVEFRREYLLRLPLPLAQLYSRAYNAKGARARHDNCFYLFESLIKLGACPLIGAYAQHLRQGGQRVKQLDAMLLELSLPSLGQWVGFLNELARHFGGLPDAASHPLGHVWAQLERKHRFPSPIVAIYRRIKNGADGAASSDATCSLRELFNALVQYRNLVFGHGAGRFESFYEQEMGPLLFPVVNEVLAEGVFDPLGPKGTRLVYLTELRGVGEGRFELGMRELVGTQGERMAPLALTAEQATSLAPNRVAVWWPGGRSPLPLDPLLAFRESEIADELLFMNRDRNGKQVEYLSYTTGRTERMKETFSALAALLSCFSGQTVTEAGLQELAEKNAGDAVPPALPSPPPARRLLGDYELLAEIGRGGMGVVYLARQQALGRLVALKSLPAEMAGDEMAMARFQREMRALSRCDHPNIVKLLDSGRLPDGNVYYTMEYVQGCDLEQVWRELSQSHIEAGTSTLGGTTFVQAVRAASSKRLEQVQKRCLTHARGDQPGTGQAETQKSGELPLLPLPPLPPLPAVQDDPGGYVRRVVALMRDVALALQTVHDQQVVHRDVSPGNMMLTADGSRVVLMDFGLAKGQSIASSVSLQGGFVGKLRYAAPEQLAASMLQVGPAADVRGLGVTLWELLTRRRLFDQAQDERQLAAAVLEKDVPRLREIDPTFDPDLDAIVARATERGAQDRIQSAERLAEYLQLFLDGRPLPIRPPTTAEMLRRWIRAHKPLVGSIAAAAALVVATVTVAFVLITGAKDEAVRLAKEKGELALREGEAHRQARRAERAAQEQRDLALDTLKKLVFEIQDKLESRVGMHAMRESLLMTAIDGIQRLQDSLRTPHADRSTAYALARLSNLLQVTGRTDDALKSLQKARSILESLASACPDDAQAQQDLVMVFDELGRVCMTLGQTRTALEFGRKELEIAERLAAKDPSAQRGLIVACCSVGDMYYKLGKPAAALEHYRRGMNLREIKAATMPADPHNQRSLATFYSRLGDVYCDLGDTRLAQEYYLKDLRITESLAGDPKDFQSQRDLVVTYGRLSDLNVTMGQTQAAMEYLQRSLKICQDTAKAQPDDTRSQNDLAISLGRLGALNLKIGQPQAALDAYAKALAIRKDLAAKEPANAAVQRNYSTACVDMGLANLRLSKTEPALKLYQEALKIRQMLAEADPDNPQAQRDLSISYSDLGDVHMGLGQNGPAMDCFQKSWKTRKALADANPASAQARRDLALGQNRLGDVSLADGNVDAALQFYQDALTTFQSLAEADSKNAEARKDLAIAYYRMGGLHLQLDQPSKALEYYRKAVPVYESLAQDSMDAESGHDLSVVCNKLGDVHLKMGQTKDAGECYRKSLRAAEAIAANPNNPEAQRDLSIAYAKLGNVSAAEKDGTRALEYFGKSLAIDQAAAQARPDDAQAQADLVSTLVNVASTVSGLGRHADAAGFYRQALDVAKRMELTGLLSESRKQWPKLIQAAVDEESGKAAGTQPASRP